MRYRRLGYQYTLVSSQTATWTLGPLWRGPVLNLVLGRPQWRPDADMCESASAIEVVVDLAGVDEDDLEIQLFDNALIVEGERRLPACDTAGIYHAAGVRQGPFRLVLPLPAAIDAEKVEAHYGRGLLQITLGKLEATP
jgi:HSP20 family protein